MNGRRVLGQVFLDGVPVEPGHGAQAAGDGGPGAAADLQVAGEAFDVGTASLEEARITTPPLGLMPAFPEHPLGTSRVSR